MTNNLLPWQTTLANTVDAIKTGGDGSKFSDVDICFGPRGSNVFVVNLVHGAQYLAGHLNPQTRACQAWYVDPDMAPQGLMPAQRNSIIQFNSVDDMAGYLRALGEALKESHSLFTPLDHGRLEEPLRVLGAQLANGTPTPTPAAATAPAVAIAPAAREVAAQPPQPPIDTNVLLPRLFALMNGKQPAGWTSTVKNQGTSDNAVMLRPEGAILRSPVTFQIPTTGHGNGEAFNALRETIAQWQLGAHFQNALAYPVLTLAVPADHAARDSVTKIATAIERALRILPVDTVADVPANERIGYFAVNGSRSHIAINVPNNHPYTAADVQIEDTTLDREHKLAILGLIPGFQWHYNETLQAFVTPVDNRTWYPLLDKFNQHGFSASTLYGGAENGEAAGESFIFVRSVTMAQVAAFMEADGQGQYTPARAVERLNEMLGTPRGADPWEFKMQSRLGLPNIRYTAPDNVADHAAIERLAEALEREGIVCFVPPNGQVLALPILGARGKNFENIGVYSVATALTRYNQPGAGLPLETHRTPPPAAVIAPYHAEPAQARRGGGFFGRLLGRNEGPA